MTLPGKSQTFSVTTNSKGYVPDGTRSLAVTCGHLQPFASSVAASKWPQVTAGASDRPSDRKWQPEQVTASDRQSKWPQVTAQVTASDRQSKWPQVADFAKIKFTSFARSLEFPP